MTFEMDYLRLLGQIGNFTKKETGVSVVDRSIKHVVWKAVH